MTQQLESIIRDLINKNSEGNFWDFKSEPHHNKSSLLHDILCLSNSLHKGDKYLIIGIEESENGVSVKGLTKKQTNRKKQSNYIDFLREKRFAGGIRPEVELQTLIIEGKEIDVLTILDRPFKPFTLTKDFRDNEIMVRAHHIYTRINDTNTPINESADLWIVENMWRERFGIDVISLDRLKLLLKEPENWSVDIGNSNHFYHLMFPEYSIILSEPDRFYEPFSYFYTNESSYWGKAKFMFHTTPLAEIEYMYCDEMRIMLPIPKTGYLDLEIGEQWYYHYILDSFEGRFLYLLTKGELLLESRGMSAPFIIFRDKSEKQHFEDYITNNQSLFNQTFVGFAGKFASKNIKRAGKEFGVDPVITDKAYQFFHLWKRNSFSNEL
jgi:hypothetical protein